MLVVEFLMSMVNFLYSESDWWRYYVDRRRFGDCICYKHKKIARDYNTMSKQSDYACRLSLVAPATGGLGVRLTF